MQITELPGLVLSAILVDKIGRKMSMVVMYSCGFICLLPLMFQQQQVVVISLLFGARLFIIGNYTVAGIYCPEVSCPIFSLAGLQLTFPQNNIAFVFSVISDIGEDNGSWCCECCGENCRDDMSSCSCGACFWLPSNGSNNFI